MEDLPTMESLDEAAMAVGYRDFSCAIAFENKPVIQSIKAQAKRLDTFYDRSVGGAGIMAYFHVASKGKIAFEEAVAAANKGDVIIYHIGQNCHHASSRLMALGAYEVGLVVLVKRRLSEDGVFSHTAVRTGRAWRPYREGRQLI